MPTDARPRVSVVVPAYYSSATVGPCLEALRGQARGAPEIVVVNSSPGDGTAEIVSRYPDVIYEESAERLLPHAARNRGVGLATGDLLVFTDPDCRARPDWLIRLVAAQRAGHGAVVGAVALAGGQPLADRAIHLCKFANLLPGLEAGPRWIAPTANAAYSRALWESCGPFDGSLYCADALMSWRAAGRGCVPWFEPRAVVEHTQDARVRSFLAQRRQRGREFGRERALYEGWSRARALVRLGAAPLGAAAAGGRGVYAALRSGSAVDALATFPLQLAGHAAWSLGEAAAHLELVRGRTAAR